MPRKSKSARSKSKFPSRHAGYVPPKLGEPLKTISAQAPASLCEDICAIAKKLGYRSTQQFLLVLFEKARDEYQANGQVEVKLIPTLPKFSERQLKKAAEEAIGSPS